jgi:hypothetical protein
MAVAVEVETLLRRIYDAFNARDVEAVLASVREDVDWPNAWEGGRVRGREPVRDYWARQFAAIDPSVTPVAFAERPDGGVAVTVHQVVRALDGALLSEGDVLHVYALRDGLVARMDVEPAG